MNRKTALTPWSKEVFVLCLFWVLQLSLPAISAATVRGFTPAASMTVYRSHHTATLLPNGQVLIVGGYSSLPLGSAELYDPKNGTFTLTGSMAITREAHTATLLRDGRVLVAGGAGSSLAEIYDPATGAFTPTGSMTISRFGHTATLLPDGAVLIAGGELPGGGQITDSAELYDPGTGTFTTAGSMTIGRTAHTATLLPSGKVLITGGWTAVTGYQSTSSAELYDPSTRAFTSARSMTTPRSEHTATLMRNGKVLIAGGFPDFNSLPSSKAELYAPKSGSFTVIGSMTTSRAAHTATLLPSGKVLMSAGVGMLGPALANLSSGELYQPKSKSFVAADGPMVYSRTGHTATLLSSGEVLITGGGIMSNSASLFHLLGTTPCTTGTPGCGWHDDDAITYQQSTWGGDFFPGSAESILAAYYSTVYASTSGILEIGIPGPDGFSMMFTNGTSLTDYLPSYGVGGPLDADLLDPASSSSGAFGGHVTAIRLAIDFNDAGILPSSPGVRLGDLTICYMSALPGLNGLRVRDFEHLANIALGGQSTPYGFADLTSIADDMSIAFQAGWANPFAREHLVNGPCP